ncbi:DNA translocase FtsK [Peribacillus deserti]
MKKLSNIFHHEEEIIEVEEIIVDDSMEAEELQRKIEQAKAKIIESGSPGGKKKPAMPEPIIEEYVPKEHKNYKPIVPIIGEASRQKRDVDAKISYQYPKGQFRFPVISDEEARTKRKSGIREPDRRSSKQKQKARGAEKPLPDYTTGNRGNSSAKIEPKKRPFRPTEIPSPIYGFKQRPPKEGRADVPSVPVYEDQLSADLLDNIAPLTGHNEAAPIPGLIYESQKYTEPRHSFEKEEVFSNTPQNEADEKGSEIQLESGHHYLVRPVHHSSGIESADLQTDGKLNSEYLDRAEQQLKDEAEPIQHSTIEEEEAVQLYQSAESEPETYEEVYEEQTATPIQHSPIEEEETVQVYQSAEITPKTYEEVYKEQTAEPIQHSPIEEEEAVQLYQSAESDPETYEEVYEDQTTEPIQHSPIEEEETVQLYQSAESEPELPVEEVYAEPLSSSEQEDKQTAVLNEPEPEKKRKTIPFNVVMLKQDKKKLPNKYTPAKANNSQKSTVLPIKAKMEHRTVKESSMEFTNEGEDLSHMAGKYTFPSIDHLTPAAFVEDDREWLLEQSEILNETLLNFNVRAKVVNVAQGPSVTRFEVQPEPGVKVNKVTNLADDIKLSLAARDIRMEAPIPGKHTIGIEIPNRKSKPVFLREVLESDAFREESSPLSVALGLDISGEPIVTDLRKMPHGLIAGATGSGKSVCINTMLVSLLYKAAPHELKLLLIDPKMVELAPYNHIPHLVSPVITDVKAATAALKWAVEEMERRYEVFAHTGVRDINRFNQKAEQAGQFSQKLPLILIIIDELADLMMVAPGEVEEAICRIAQKARACGIHLILATQRPSVDVITGLIKANIPTRIAFSVSSQIDSRTIIDTAGAEKLLGRGDMLFAENGSSKTVRIQGTFVSDDEIDQVVEHVKMQQEPQYLFEQEELMKKTQIVEDADELFFDACEFVVNQTMASASSLQRRFHIGYNRAARLIEMMEVKGIISEARGSKPREVLISEDELEYINANTMA